MRGRASPDTKLPVLIELADQPAPAPTIERQAEADALAASMQASRSGLMDQLTAFGLPLEQIRTFSLVNAVSTALTPDQIRTVAERDDVRFIRYEGEKFVAL
jgi:hypothetical protein